MSEADFQLTLTTVSTVVVAITGTITAVFGYRNHVTGQQNAAAIAEVKAATDGTNHTLAANLAANQAANENVIRAIAASTIPSPPPPP